MTTLNSLLQPRRVAIVGASADATKLAGRALVYLQ
jgi:acyl-CoA synthetase (NDP forming)